MAGPSDTHCGDTIVTVDPNICTTAGNTETTDDAGDGGYGDTLYNAEGDDDDCKYHVSWTSTAVCENANVTFNLTVTNKSEGSPVAGAEPNVEAFLNDTHPGGVSSQMWHENSPGVYSIGPVQFDTTGQWTVRFHIFPMACDMPESQHGHAAFYVDVP